MEKLTQKQIIAQQSQAISIITNRLFETELLLASITDLLHQTNVINRGDLEVIINEKVELLKSKADLIKNQNEDIIESFPYFGKPGEA